MNVRIFQHVPFESPGSIEGWARRAGHDLALTRLFAGDAAPPPDRGDLLVVLGGPMGVHDEARHTWLVAEKRSIAAWIGAGKPVLGVCLGAQIVAGVLGARVTRNREAEIGWFPVWRASQAGDGPFARAIPDGEAVFHWHEETFELPAGARRLARSEACENQAFLYGERVLGLQFHLEVTTANIRSMIENSGGEITPGPHVETPQAMLANAVRAEAMNSRMDRILEALVAPVSPPA